METSAEIQLLLLTIIEKNGNIDDLYSIGYEYFQILELVKNEEKEGNAMVTDNGIMITEQGKIKKKELMLKMNKSQEGRNLIMPQLSKRVEVKISKWDVFVPDENDIPF